MKKWTKELVIEESKKYKSQNEFVRKSQSAYNSARRNGWLGLLNFEIPKRTFWSYESVIEESKKYNTKVGFMNNSGGAYKYAVKNNILKDMTWLISNGKDIRPRCVYAYIDEYNKVVYVGLTVNKIERHKDHLTGKHRGHFAYSAVYNYFKSINKNVPEPIYLEDGLTIIEAQDREDYWLNYYRDNGYKLLNKGKTGSNVGSIGSSFKWTKESVFEEAKKYKSRSEFELNCCGAYNRALREHWFDEMDWFKPYHVLSKEEVECEARKYEYVVDFMNNSISHYRRALNKGWLKEFTWLKNKYKNWNKDDVFFESRKYTNRNDFLHNSYTAYNLALKNGWLDEMTWLIPQKSNWTKENVFEEARKYKYKVDFKKYSPIAYQKARKEKWLDEMTWFIYKVDRWTKERCIESSKEFTSRSTFKLGKPRAYVVSRQNGWLDEIAKLNGWK